MGCFDDLGKSLIYQGMIEASKDKNGEPDKWKGKRQTAYTDVRIKRSTGKGTKPPTRTSSYKFISGPDKSIWPFGNPSNQDAGHSGRKTKQNRGPK